MAALVWIGAWYLAEQLATADTFVGPMPEALILIALTMLAPPAVTNALITPGLHHQIGWLFAATLYLALWPAHITAMSAVTPSLPDPMPIILAACVGIIIPASFALIPITSLDIPTAFKRLRGRL